MKKKKGKAGLLGGLKDTWDEVGGALITDVFLGGKFGGDDKEDL